MRLIWQLAPVAIGLTCGNFSYQDFAGHDWAVAFERSVFQIFALVAAWIAISGYAWIDRIEKKAAQPPTIGAAVKKG